MPRGIMYTGVKAGDSLPACYRKPGSSSYSGSNIFMGREIFKMNQNLLCLRTTSDIDFFTGNAKYENHLWRLTASLCVGL